MSFVQIKRPRVEQPTARAALDTNGLGKSIKILFNPALGPSDQVNGRVWTPNGDAAVKDHGRNKVFAFDGTDDYLSYTGYPDLTGNTGTFFIWCPIVGAADAFGHVLISSASPTVFAPQIQADSTINIPGPGASSGSINWFNTTNTSLVLSFGGTAATMKAYLNGVDTGLTWSGSDPADWGAGSKTINLGRYVGGTAWDFSGEILSTGWDDAVWTAALANRFHQSRGNSVYKPRRVSVYIAAGGGAAALACTAQSVAVATGVLSTQINLANAAQSQATASGALTTNIALAGNPVSVSAANGALTTQIQLSGAALAQAISTAALSTGINLSASSVAVAAASGMLDTVLKLVASAQAVASATGDLTTGGAGALSSGAQASATATGSLTAQIRLNASALAQALSVSGLSTQINLASSAQCGASASGSITTSIQLNVAAVAQAIATGSLTVQTGLSANAVAQATATGTLFGQNIVPTPAWRTLILEGESRMLIIESENRTLSA